MNIIVSGGAGFIGSNLVDKLVDNGHDVLVLDNLSSGDISNLNKNAKFIEIDLAEKSEYKNIPKTKYDAFYHLASHVGQELSFKNPIIDLKSNALSTAIVINWCLKNKIKRFIFTSSVNVYGDIKKNPVDERTKINPRSPYAVAKMASENLINIYSESGINTTIFRFLNIYGPRQDISNLNQGMASIYMGYVNKNLPIIIKGSLERYRDFTYVDDTVNALILCLDNKKSYGKTYVLSSGIKTTVRELINKILISFGKDPESYPLIIEKPTKNDQFGFFGDSSLIKNDLKWEPQINLQNGLKNMVNWIIDKEI